MTADAATAVLHGFGQHKAPPPAPRALPHNLEAEQALLGVALYDNAALDRVEGVEAAHFYEPVHQRLWEAIVGKVQRGTLAEPITLADAFGADPAFEELGGLRYLADLVDRAPPSANVSAYAETVLEVGRRRDLVLAGEKMAASAIDYDVKVEDLVSEAERALHGAAMAGSARVQFIQAGAAAAAVLDRLDTPDEAEGVAWGLAPLDRQLGSMQEGDLIVLGGRPSMGKSALASEIAMNVALHGKAVVEINGEMSVEQMTRRHLTSLAFTMHGADAPSYSDIRKRALKQGQRQMLTEAAEVFGPLPVSMLKRTGLGLASLRSLVRRERMVWERRGVPLGALVVDHVGLIKADRGGRSRYEDQTAVSNGMKELADELGIPIIALAQLSRETEKRDNKRPTLSDLRDSGAWEQDADVVVGIYRDAYYASREPEPKDDGKPGNSNAWAEWDARRRSRTIEAIILKAREGECGTVELWGDMRTNAIRADAPDRGGFL